MAAPLSSPPTTSAPAATPAAPAVAVAPSAAAVVCKPIVYGNTALQLARPSPSGHTHTWTIYFKSATGEDLSPVLANVVFKLHDSFPNPERVIEKPPYEVTESGWGEFEAYIIIHFVDPAEKPIHLTHFLKLYPNADTLQPTKKSLVAERYDELLFVEPSELMQQALIKCVPGPSNKRQAARDYDVEEQRQLDVLQNAKLKLRHHVREMKARYQDADTRLKALQGEMEKAGAS